MPTFAPVSSTAVGTPAILATLNDYHNSTLIPQGYQRTVGINIAFGQNDSRMTGLGDRPNVPLQSFRKPKRKTGEGTQAEMILNFETAGNMQAFWDLQDLDVGIYQGGTKIFTPWAHYTTYVAMGRTQAKENSGPGKQYDILKSMLEQSSRDAFDKLETDFLSANADINHNSAQHELAGLRHWNATSPSSGTQHGLDRSVYTPFRNQTATITSFAATGIDQMDDFWYTTGQYNGNQSVDAILTTPTEHGRYSKQAMAVHRLVGSLEGVDLGTKGFLYFKGIPILHSPRHPSGRMDWINTADLHTFILQGDDWAQETPGKPNDVAIEYEQRWFFTAAIMHARPETNGVITVSGA